MKFNMGCGQKKLAGWVNVDAEARSEPDQVFDLEQSPWPWPDDCASDVLFNHSLEHMGGDPKVFLAMMKELYRIAAPGCAVQINVPHPRHDNFISDPTHVRAITPETFRLFDQALNREAISLAGSNTPLGLYLGVDFVLENTITSIAEPYWSRHRAGELSLDVVREMIATMTNVAKEYRITLRVRKSEHP